MKTSSFCHLEMMIISICNAQKFCRTFFAKYRMNSRHSSEKSTLKYSDWILKIECGTWYHHPRRLQCVLSRNRIMFHVATWRYRCRHNIKNNGIWDNLQCYLLVPRSPSKPLQLTFDLQSRKVLFIEIVSGMYNLERQLWYWYLLTRHCPCNLLPEPTSPKHEYIENFEATPWRHRWRHHHNKTFLCIIWDDLFIT